MRAVAKAVIGLVVSVTVAVICVTLAVFVIPISHSLSGQVSTAYCSGCTGSPYFGYHDENLPSGPVSISWQSTSSSYVQFEVFPADVNDLATGACSESGTSGTCQFASDGGTYTLALTDGDSGQTIETVTWTGTYQAPLL